MKQKSFFFNNINNESDPIYINIFVFIYPIQH